MSRGEEGLRFERRRGSLLCWSQWLRLEARRGSLLEGRRGASRGGERVHLEGRRGCISRGGGGRFSVGVAASRGEEGVRFERRRGVYLERGRGISWSRSHD